MKPTPPTTTMTQSDSAMARTAKPEVARLAALVLLDHGQLLERSISVLPKRRAHDV